MSFMEVIFLGGMFIAAPIISGLHAAERQCKLLEQVKDVKKKTAEFVLSQEKLYKQLQILDNAILSATEKLQNDMQDTTELLLQMKIEFAVSMKQLQLVIACVIIIVFMLLLGKKLKIY